MIEGSKQQQLTFEKGITNVPSDLLCSDNALEESVGMIYDNGDHRVIQKPKFYLSFPIPPSEEEEDEWPNTTVCKLLYIHKFNLYQRYILAYCKNPNNSNEPWYLRWATGGVTTIALKTKDGNDFSTENPDIDITSVGKTLIVNAKDGLQYFLWKENEYKNLGIIPVQHVEFAIDEGRNSTIAFNKISSGSCEHIRFEHTPDSPAYWRVGAECMEDWNTLIFGLYAKNKRSIDQQKQFHQPFLVRTALKLYDGSYIYVSQPILLFPAIYGSYMDYLNGAELQLTTRSGALIYYNKSYDGITAVEQHSWYEEWTDIVKDIVIFITDGIECYDTSIDARRGPFRYNPDPDMGTHTTTGIWMGYDSGTGSSTPTFHSISRQGQEVLPTVESSEIENEITSRSVFYKLCSIGLFEFNALFGTDIASKVTRHHLENLTTQEQLEYDDYFSRSRMVPRCMYTYNGRLNLANVSRDMFEGFGYFLSYEKDGFPASGYQQSVRFYVTIQTDDGERIVRHDDTSKYILSKYFFYPDSRAKHVKIFRQNQTGGWNCLLDEDLKEHEGLNGAYYFGGLPSASDNETYRSIELPTVNNKPEILGNYIVTSEVNNPWVFRAEGYNKVGTGEVIGISTITQALSQGQFGEYPLLVFSESGVWGMSVNGTGLFQAIHPMSREVCNNANSITQTDGAVFFSSEKGLMVVVGGDVRCVSEQLSGRNADFTGEISMGNFRDYLKNCFIAYDYRDSLLWIFNNSRQQNNKYCYVYSIKSGTFGKFEFVSPITNVVNNYPDYLLQTGSRVYSLTERVNINLDSDEYDGLIITRPMKLENGLALKSLMQVRHIKQMQGDMTLRIFASNNTEHWVELHSLRGTPWKYYRFRYDFTSLAATDRFAGSVVITQERRTDKLL